MICNVCTAKYLEARTHSGFVNTHAYYCIYRATIISIQAVAVTHMCAIFYLVLFSLYTMLCYVSATRILVN